MSNTEIKFVQLEPGAFLRDSDFIQMTPAQRGVYVSLILALYCNGGLLKINKNTGRICGCSYSNFIKIFAKISFKFSEKNGKIFHKKVSKVLAKQKKLVQIARKSGLRGGRPKKGTLYNENEKRNEIENVNINSSNSKSNVTKVSMQKEPVSDILPAENSISTNSLSRSSSSLRDNSQDQEFQSRKSIITHALMFDDRLNKILFAKTRSDRTCFLRIKDFLIAGCKSGKFDVQIFERAIQYAEEAKSGDNPNALFMSLMRSQLGFQRRKR
jgi:uncharacterized protein YdaU (DUF1376 family)